MTLRLSYGKKKKSELRTTRLTFDSPHLEVHLGLRRFQAIVYLMRGHSEIQDIHRSLLALPR